MFWFTITPVLPPVFHIFDGTSVLSGLSWSSFFFVLRCSSPDCQLLYLTASLIKGMTINMFFPSLKQRSEIFTTLICIKMLSHTKNQIKNE